MPKAKSAGEGGRDEECSCKDCPSCRTVDECLNPLTGCPHEALCCREDSSRGSDGARAKQRELVDA